MKTLLKFMVTLMMCFSLSYAAIIQVPVDVNTIQGGINLANPGDMVLVKPGVYFENINFKGKAITVASRFILDGNAAHIASTIINGSRPSHPDSGSVVYFVNGENSNSVLCGFTITGGSGTIFDPETDARVGGGICAINSSAHIKNNYIVKNHIHYDFDTFGGGIYFWGISDRDCIIENNVIARNEIISNQTILFSLGGGIYTNGISNTTIRISNNKILDNSISAEFAWGGGIQPSNFDDANYFIENNLVSGNKVTASIFGGSGGIDVFDHFPVIRNNIISNNYAPFGGGMSIEIYGSTSTAAAEAVLKRSPREPAMTKSNWKYQNSAAELAYFSNNTLYNNSAAYSGGGVAVFGSIIPQLMNFIVWGNTAPDGAQISGSADFQYSDVEGGRLGTGNLDENPRFLSPMLFLGLMSPCIDAGNPDPLYNDPESIFQPGYARWPAMRTVRNDMGAYGGPGAADWCDFLDLNKKTEDFKVDEADINPENNEKSVPINQFPNPFNNQATFQFELPRDSFVSLKIFNILGQEVANLVSQRLTAGIHKYVWNAAEVASGTYVYRLEVNGNVYQNKMILMQ